MRGLVEVSGDSSHRPGRQGFLHFSAPPVAAGQLLTQKPWLLYIWMDGRTFLWRLSILGWYLVF